MVAPLRASRRPLPAPVGWRAIGALPSAPPAARLDRCRHRPGRLPWAALGALVVLVGGCGGDVGPGPSPSSFHGPTYRLEVAQVGGLGRVLVDGKGDTVYLFVPDHHSGRSRCTGICAVEWPPLVLPAKVTAPVAGRGVRASLLGTTRRPGGRLQVTYGGWPLYRWFADTAPGMATGQGLDNLGGLWYVVSPSGQPVR